MAGFDFLWSYLGAPCLGAAVLAIWLARMPRFAANRQLLRALAEALGCGSLAISRVGGVARPLGTFCLVVDGLLLAVFLLLAAHYTAEVRWLWRASGEVTAA